MPRKIKYFEWTWLGSLVIGIIVSALSYSETVSKGPPSFYVDMQILAVFRQFFVLGIILLLVLLISRKRSNIAKWILVALFGLGMLIFYIPQLTVLFNLGFVGVLSSLQAVAQCVGIYFLFSQESRDWFKVKET